MPRSCQDYAEIIASTVREPFLVLNEDLQVIGASRSFYQKFRLSPDEAEGRTVFKLGHGQWDIPDLRRLLEQVILDNHLIEDFKIKYTFKKSDEVNLRLNARRVVPGALCPAAAGPA